MKTGTTNPESLALEQALKDIQKCLAKQGTITSKENIKESWCMSGWSFIDEN